MRAQRVTWGSSGIGLHRESHVVGSDAQSGRHPLHGEELVQTSPVMLADHSLRHRQPDVGMAAHRIGGWDSSLALPGFEPGVQRPPEQVRGLSIVVLDALVAGGRHLQETMQPRVVVVRGQVFIGLHLLSGEGQQHQQRQRRGNFEGLPLMLSRSLGLPAKRRYAGFVDLQRRPDNLRECLGVNSINLGCLKNAAENLGVRQRIDGSPGHGRAEHGIGDRIAHALVL